MDSQIQRHTYKIDSKMQSDNYCDNSMPDRSLSDMCCRWSFDRYQLSVDKLLAVYFVDLLFWCFTGFSESSREVAPTDGIYIMHASERTWLFWEHRIGCVAICLRVSEPLPQDLLAKQLLHAHADTSVQCKHLCLVAEQVSKPSVFQ